MDDAHVSGTTVTDSAGSLNGTINNVTHVTSGTYARNLDGSGYISLASSPISNFATAHSVFQWVKITTPQASGGNAGSQTMLNFATDASNGLRFAINEGSVDGFVACDFVVSLLKAGTNIGVQTNFANERPLKAGLLWLIGYTFDGTNIVTYSGTDTISNTGQTSYGVQNANIIGARASDLTGSVTGAIGRVLTYSRALTATDVKQIHRAGPVGIPSRKRTMRLTAGMASNTLANSYVEFSEPSLQVGFMKENIAVGGETLAHFDTNFATWVQPFFDSSVAMNLLTIQCTNDMDAGLLTGAQAYALAVSIAGKWKALGAGAKVLVVGAWNYGGDSGFLQRHLDFNNLVIANTPGTFDGYVDTWNIPNLNTGTTALSTTYSLDNDHLTKAGHQLVVPYYVAGVNAIWSS